LARAKDTDLRCAIRFLTNLKETYGENTYEYKSNAHDQPADRQLVQ